MIRQLNAELAAPRRSDGKVLVYLLTHGECQLPESEVQTLASRAPIYGVFILPSGALDLGYLHHLYRVHVIDDNALSHGRRAQRARQIISDVEANYRGPQRPSQPRGPQRSAPGASAMSSGTGKPRRPR